MKWYDVFSNFYDNSLEKLYFSSRKRAIELLDLRDHLTVMDLACGTGANFTHILPANNTIMLYGTDYSPGMLNKAQNLIKKNQWDNVKLFQADARTLSTESIEKYIGKKIKFDGILCVLGLSVVPQWEIVLDNLIELLNDNGKIVIVDVYAEKRTFHKWLIEKIAKSTEKFGKHWKLKQRIFIRNICP
ncbi:MAG: class I SAM-dependent methyltransferase [Bacteroidota bacterium]